MKKLNQTSPNWCLLYIYSLVTLHIIWLILQFSLEYINVGSQGWFIFKPKYSKLLVNETIAFESWLEESNISHYEDLRQYALNPLRRRQFFECAENIGLSSKTCGGFTKGALRRANLITDDTLSIMKFIKSRITKNQFPNSPCENQRYTRLHPGGQCGFGSQLHWVVSALMFSHLENRVLVLEYPYLREDLYWENWFELISSCQIYYWNWKITKLMGIITMEYISKAYDLKSHTSTWSDLEWAKFFDYAKQHLSASLQFFTNNHAIRQWEVDDIKKFEKWYNYDMKDTSSLFYTLFDALISKKDIYDGAPPLESFKLSLSAGRARELLKQQLDTWLFSFHDYNFGTMPSYILSHINAVTHVNPFSWYVGVCMNWLFDLKNERVRNFIDSHREQLNITTPLLGGIHVRRTDKINHEASSYELSKYLIALQRLINATNKYEEVIKPPYLIYLATDEPDVLQEIPATENYIFYYDWLSANSAKNLRTSQLSTDFILFELEILSEAKFFVGTFTSNYGRLVAELKTNYRRDSLLYCVSIDTSWGFY